MDRRRPRPDEPADPPRPRKRRGKKKPAGRRGTKLLLIWGGAAALFVAVAAAAVGVAVVAHDRAAAPVAVDGPPAPAAQPAVQPAPPPEPTPAPPPAPAAPAKPAAAEPPPPPFGRRFSAKEQEEKLREALVLCGRTAFPGPGSPPATFSVGIEDFFDRPEVERHAVLNDGANALQMRKQDWSIDLGDIFPRSAQAVARKAPRATFFVEFSPQAKPVPFEPIRAILGREDSTAPGGLPVSATAKLPVTWHFYGWCGFGVGQRGTVVALKADCSKVTPPEPEPGTTPAPPAVAERPAREPPLFRLRFDGPVGAAFAAGGAELVTWEEGGTIRIWSVKDGKEKKKLTVGAKAGPFGGGFSGPLQRAAPYGPSRWMLLSGAEALIWDPAKGTLTPAAPEAAGRVVDWHVTATDALLLTRDREVIDVRRPGKPRPLGRPTPGKGNPLPGDPFERPGPGRLNPAPADLSGRPDPPDWRREPVAAFSADGRRVVWADRDRLSVYDAATGKELFAVPEAGFANALSVSADGSRAATAEARPAPGGFGVGPDWQAVRVWDLKAKSRPTGFSRGPNDVPYPLGGSVALSPDGRRVLVCWLDEKRWSVLELVEPGGGSSRVLDEAPPPLPPASITEGFNLGGGRPSPRLVERRIESALFAPDGKHALSSGRYDKAGTEVCVWRLAGEDAPRP